MEAVFTKGLAAASFLMIVVC